MISSSANNFTKMMKVHEEMQQEGFDSETAQTLIQRFVQGNQDSLNQLRALGLVIDSDVFTAKGLDGDSILMMRLKKEDY